MAKKDEFDVEKYRKQFIRWWRKRNKPLVVPKYEGIQKYKVPIINKEVPLPKITKKRINDITIPIIKKKFYFDHEIPGIIQDVIENLGFENKDKKVPKIVSKKRTDEGWYLVIKLVAGCRFKDFYKNNDYFSDLTNSFVTITWDRGNVHMNIKTNKMPEKVNYQWDPTPYLEDGMILPIPMGYSRDGLVVIDLADGAPHLLAGGGTNFGKTNQIFVIVHSLLQLPPERVRVSIIDRKEVDFAYLKDDVLLASTEEEALKLLKYLWKEHMKRKDILLQYGVKKIQQLPKEVELPYIVCIIDEFAQLLNEESHFLIDQFVRLSRAMGIHLIAATQRPSSKKMDTDTRSQFDLRLCFPVSNEIDSRMILGEQNSEAAWLPRIQGRALFKNGMDLIEVQTMYLSDKKAKQLLKTSQHRGWALDTGHKLKP